VTEELLSVRDYLSSFPEHRGGLPGHTLFVLTTLFAMYLRVSDLTERDNWELTMGDFRRDSLGNGWFHVVGKGNKSAKISVRDDYVQTRLDSPALAP